MSRRFPAARFLYAVALVATGAAAATTAQAGCRAAAADPLAVLDAGAPGAKTTAHDHWLPMLHGGMVVWVPVRHWPDIPAVALPGDDALRAHHRDAPIPVDANGFPRRRC